MYSETLRLMDQNMIKFMIDEQKEIRESAKSITKHFDRKGKRKI